MLSVRPLLLPQLPSHHPSCLAAMSSAHKKQHGGEIVTIQCGTIANWIGAQYHLLQNSNCDVNAPYLRSTHFRRSGGGNGGGAGNEGAWSPRVVSLDSSVGLDGVVATYGAQEGAGAAQTQERALQQYRMEKREEAAMGGSSSSSAAAAKTGGGRPKHWSELSKNVWSYHSKSLYSMPGLYEGTSDFHLHEQGCALMGREVIHEEVLDRVRWFLEECDQPDGIHMIVEANSAWAGVGSTMLNLLRDEYEKIPIFCVSALVPPPPSSLLGSTFASATPLVQSVLNSSLFLNTATQLASAYLPLTSHYWATHPAARQAVDTQMQKAIQQGEVFETSTLMALQLHLATASYRSATAQQRPEQRALNMAAALGGLTQQSQANVLGLKFVTDLGAVSSQELRGASSSNASSGSSSNSNAGSRESSSAVAVTPTLHTLPSAVPMSLLGHWHAYPAPKVAAAPGSSYAEYGSSAPAAFASSSSSSSSSSAAAASVLCDRNCALTESVHVFGNTEEMSHSALLVRMEAQSPALYRVVSGSSRLNLPPSFPTPTFHDLLMNEQGTATSLYRCQSLGQEMRQLGVWMSNLNRGTVLSSSYVQTEGPVENAPSFLLNPNKKPRHAGDKTTERAEQFQLSFTQEQIDEITECGVSLQNLAELY